MSWHAGDPDLAACGGRAVAQPAAAPAPRVSSRKPLSQAAFCASGRTAKPGGSSTDVHCPSVNRYPQEDQTVCCFNCAPLGQWPGGLTGIKPAFDFR